MEGFWILIGLGIVSSVLVTPFVVINLMGRVRKLEQREKARERGLQHLRQELDLLLRQTNEPVQTTSVKAVDQLRAAEAAEREQVVQQEEALVFQESSAAAGDDLKELSAQDELRQDIEEPITSREESEVKEQVPFVSWLKKMGLMPPGGHEEGVNLMAWWSTRIGLGFGVIAAVFLGLYVNQDTSPLVRLLELVLASIGVFGVGCWFERKLQNFGRALTVGGLALLYVAAFAAYGLPAMKVIESPLVGALVQFGALTLTTAWSLWRGRESLFGLALVLGYVTCGFAAAEGLAPVALISLLILSAAGSLMFAWRCWWVAMWLAIFGSGLGLAFLAGTTWSAESGPSQWVGLASALAVTLFPLLALARQRVVHEEQVRLIVPLVTSIGLLAGAVGTWIRGLDYDLYYASFTVLLFVAGWWWKRLKSEGLWQTLWVKASVLLALLVIATFDGPVRSFSLLTQAGGLLFLARNRSRVVFEVGAALAAIVGWSFLQETFAGRPIMGWRVEDYSALGYLFAAQVLVLFYRYLLGEERVRRLLVGVMTMIIAGLFVYIASFDVGLPWGFLMPLGFGILSLMQTWLLRQQDGWIASFVVLIGTLLVLINRWESDLTVGWQALIWLLFAYAFYTWFQKQESSQERLGAGAVLWASVVAIVIVADQMLGARYLSVVGFLTAVLWSAVGQWRGLRFLIDSAALPGMLAAGYFLLSENDVAGAGLGGLVLILVLAWWVMGFWERKESSEDELLKRMLSYARTSAFGAVVLRLLAEYFEGADMIAPVMLLSTGSLVAWRFLKEESLSWLGAIFASIAFWMLLSSVESEKINPGLVVLVAVLLAANGIWLVRSLSRDVLARPRVASVVWGTAALLVILVGYGIGEQVVKWMTAAWAAASVALLVSGFWAGLRGYRVIGLIGLGATIIRLFAVDIQDGFWRIIAFGLTGTLLIGIGYLYHRFHQRLANSDLDWGQPMEG